MIVGLVAIVVVNKASSLELFVEQLALQNLHILLMVFTIALQIMRIRFEWEWTLGFRLLCSLLLVTAYVGALLRPP